MARGDIHWFAAFDYAAKNGVSFNLSADTLKLGIVTAATIPTIGADDPRWGAGGTVNFATNEVPTGTGYAGSITLTGVTWTRLVGVAKLTFANVVVPIDATGFTTGAYAILYDSTVGNYALGFIDLGGPVSIQVAPMNININAGGFGTDTAS